VTERLYYHDSYLQRFGAHLVSVSDVGGRPGVVLDRTAFYPTSGGQPFDTGMLGGARVIDVVDREDGAIVHVVDGVVECSVIGTGDSSINFVEGSIDWARRFEHMQQHTGQHVLSAAIDRVCGVPTESFHLGGTFATIDLPRELTVEEITDAEDLANAVVWEDRPVTIAFVDAEDSSALQLRKESARTGTLRIIDVEHFDVSACGGTHVARTGAIGVIAVSGWERLRGGTRLEFRCGVRALHRHRALRDTVAAASRLLSTAAEDLPASIDRLQQDGRDLRRRLKDIEGRLAGFEADAVAARAEVLHGCRVVAEAVPGADMNAIKTVAQSVAARAGHVAVLLTAASPASVVVARAADVPLDCARIVKQLIAHFGGKGGGRPELAQGGGLLARADEIVAAARRLLSELLDAGRQ
jgi:alanyl-tRNA synthetase